MESRLFNIGDIVSLNTHPYLEDLTNIIISGDHLMIPPLMLISDVLKLEMEILGRGKTKIFEYKCVYFSPKKYEFVQVQKLETELKLIKRSTTNISATSLRRGDKVTLKSMEYELAKKKSSLSYEDNSVNTDNGSTTINSLLSFLPPILQVINVSKHKTKYTLPKAKSHEDKRILPSWDVSYLIFDPTIEKMSELILPIEVLEIVSEVSKKTLLAVSDTIVKGGYLKVQSNENITFLKPRNIANRGGMYFLRAYDYKTNKVEELNFSSIEKIITIPTPFKSELPTFDLIKNPDSATPNFIQKEMEEGIEKAKSNGNYIRIKYKNRNEQITHRTLSNFTKIEVKELGKNIGYIKGFCSLRHAERTFRMDRIQNLQELDLTFPT